MKLFSKVLSAGLLVAVIGSGGLIAYSQGDPPEYGRSNTAFQSLLAKADEQDQHVKDDLRHVKHLQDQARKMKDIIKLTCVNDKYVACKAEANVFDDTMRTLRSMSGESSNRGGTFEQVAAAASQVHEAREGADACIGETVLGDEASNSFSHPYMPDPTLGDPYGGGVEPPGYASPYN